EALPPPPSPEMVPQGSIELPPGTIDADELGDLHRQVQKTDPAGYAREFGAVTLNNPNVPPDIAAGTMPPPDPDNPRREMFNPAMYSLQDASFLPNATVS